MAVFGLAPARTVASQARLIEELKAGSLAWKTRAGEAAARAKSLEAELERQARDAERSRIAAEKLRAQGDALLQLKERLAESERELTLARELLMAIEVKLDILEGAANVLDVRTRSTVSRQRSESGAPV